jgi:hypothetical protein
VEERRQEGPRLGGLPSRHAPLIQLFCGGCGFGGFAEFFRINSHLGFFENSYISKQMLSLYGNVYTSGHTADPAVLKQVVRSGNLEKQDKAKIVKAIVAAEKADEKAKMPAVNLRAMYGN